MKEIQITIMDTGDFEVVSRGTTQTFPAAKVTEREEIALFTKQCPRCEEQLEADATEKISSTRCQAQEYDIWRLENIKPTENPDFE
jgi:hypothetical protein